MKKIISILILTIAINLTTKAQQVSHFIAGGENVSATKNTVSPADLRFAKTVYALNNNIPDKDYNYYMRKRKTNLTVGLVTLGAGLALAGVGLSMAANSSNDATGRAGGVMTILGAVSGLTSIPFMIMAEANKKKARLILKNEKTGFGLPPNTGKDIMAISLVIPIGK